MQPHSLESSMSERDEMRRLIDVIEKSAATASVQQNAEDLKLFVNTASYIANKLDAKLRATKTSKTKRTAKLKPLVSPLPLPKPKQLQQKQNSQNTAQKTALPRATSTATSSADFERLRSIKPIAPQAPLSPSR